MITMRLDTSRADRRLDKLPSQLKFATARALTQTAKDAEKGITKQLPQIFERPNPFTKRGIGITPAKKTRLSAAVFVKRQQAEYLHIQERGGVRRPVPRSPILVPVHIRTNVYGNIARGKIARETAKPQTFVASGKDARTRHLKPGIYRRYKRTKRNRARAPKLLAALHRQARYAPRFNFIDRVTQIVKARFPERWKRSVDDAIRTAR